MKLLFLVIHFAYLVFSAFASGASQPAGHKLKDISVFHQYDAYRESGKNAPVSCQTWGDFELENDSLPLETNIRNGRKKVYRINASSNGGIMFPIHNWASFSIEQYYENGFIEFDVRGSSGNEDFTIVLRSDTRGAVLNRSVSLSSQNIKITNSWQNVKIPVKNIVGNINDGFSLKHIRLITLEIPGNTLLYLSEMYITSPDNEKQYPVIKVNQVGYEINHQKYALVSCFPGTLSLSARTEFNVINIDGEVKYTGRLQQISGNVGSTSGEIVYKADFSLLNENGMYFIRITNPLIEDSFIFKIGRNIYNDLFKDTMKYYYFQRQGIDLEQRYAGVFARKNLHPGDSTVRRFSQRDDPTAPVFDVSGGWYDAGDFGKYFPPAAAAVTDLLLAYEFFPQGFSDNQFNIPESGNGAADILDEIKWELDMMLKMEDGSTGSFYEVANYDGDVIFMIDTHGVTGAGNTKSTAATAWAAGVFAHAYMVYKNIPLYRNFAEQCLNAATRAWTYMENNPNEHSWVSAVGRSYFYDTVQIEKIKFMAAASLYRATGGEKFNNYIIANYRGFNYEREFNAYHVATTGEIGIGFIFYAGASNPSSDVMRFFDERFRNFEAMFLRTYNDKAWPTVLFDWAFFWGSNMPIVRIPVEMYMFNKVLNTDTSESLKLMRDSVHYILGINPLSFSFISGYGDNCVVNIFSGIYSYDGIDEIPSGYLAGGANQYEAGMLSNFPAKCYVDSDMEWTTNEHTIYWNAAMVLCLAAMVE